MDLLYSINCELLLFFNYLNLFAMKIYPVVAGDLSGKMDRTVFYKMEDRCFGRKKAQYVKREFSEVERKQHLVFGFMNNFADEFTEVAEILERIQLFCPVEHKAM